MLDPLCRGLDFAVVRRKCPGFRKSKVLGWADHNVLEQNQDESARTILDWINIHHQVKPDTCRD